jgi:hypothetical protein
MPLDPMAGHLIGSPLSQPKSAVGLLLWFPGRPLSEVREG